MTFMIAIVILGLDIADAQDVSTEHKRRDEMPPMCIARAGLLEEASF